MDTFDYFLLIYPILLKSEGIFGFVKKKIYLLSNTCYYWYLLIQADLDDSKYLLYTLTFPHREGCQELPNAPANLPIVLACKYPLEITSHTFSLYSISFK